MCFRYLLFFGVLFYMENKDWFVIDNILSKNICRFCSCAQFSNIYRQNWFYRQQCVWPVRFLQLTEFLEFFSS